MVLNLYCFKIIHLNLGPEELRGFAETSCVKEAFVASVFGLHSVGPSNKESGDCSAWKFSSK